MFRRYPAYLALFSAAASPGLFAQPPAELYMRPPVAELPSAVAAVDPQTEPVAVSVEPVVAPRPGSVGEAPRVEVVFVLDTTGSMGGLIAAAKDKIWAIANTLALAEPAPEIKLGLVGYRDRGDVYVTTVTDLTTDLDAVYAALTAFQADGGGDGPESVNQALRDAVEKVTWSADDKTYRVIYLVGDAPPHMDYADDVKYPQTCEAAVKRDILINAIQCGGDPAAAAVWQEIASLGEGQFFRIDQDGGGVVRATPFDAELADLAAKLDATKHYYGTAEQQTAGAMRAEVAAKFYAPAPVTAADGAPEPAARGTAFRAGGAAEGAAAPATAALARRAVYNASDAGAANFLGEQELVDAFRRGAVKLEELKAEELPEDLRRLSNEELAARLKEQAAEREKLQAQIRKLADERQKFLEAELEKDDAARPELDLKLFDSIREQAAGKGIEYAAPGPAF